MKSTKTEINKYRVTEGPMASDDKCGNAGAFIFPLSDKKAFLQVISDDGKDSGWEHVSVVARRKSGKKYVYRTPFWEEMCLVKNLFWGKDETVIQYHPPESEYINKHPNCLHLWRQKDVTIQLPPSELIG